MEHLTHYLMEFLRRSTTTSMPSQYRTKQSFDYYSNLSVVEQISLVYVAQLIGSGDLKFLAQAGTRKNQLYERHGSVGVTTRKMTLYNLENTPYRVHLPMMEISLSDRQ
eukprot:gnl/Chilomastix_caulleri/4283.p1 GENE.gnl/Chilomastix_caulleri/4283~~gnl/Chilomastix_caulleri/4283.p1  ORF type:complete len:109 (-),score=6.91 gnl/Chilomastix_caulleri/4283:12-338(-)